MNKFSCRKMLGIIRIKLSLKRWSFLQKFSGQSVDQKLSRQNVLIPHYKSRKPLKKAAMMEMMLRVHAIQKMNRVGKKCQVRSPAFKKILIHHKDYFLLLISCSTKIVIFHLNPCREDKKTALNKLSNSNNMISCLRALI